MKKRVLSFLTVVALVCSLLPHTALAEDTQYSTYEIPETNIVLYYTVNINGNAAIQGCNYDASGRLEIPGQINGYPVTQITRIRDPQNNDYDHGYGRCRDITAIMIPDTVTSIGVASF